MNMLSEQNSFICRRPAAFVWAHTLETDKTKGWIPTLRHKIKSSLRSGERINMNYSGGPPKSATINNSKCVCGRICFIYEHIFLSVFSLFDFQILSKYFQALGHFCMIILDHPDH